MQENKKRRFPNELISGHWTRCLHKLCEYNEYKMRTFDKVEIFAENNDDYFEFLYRLKNDCRPPESINVGVVYNLVRKQR